MLSTFQFQFSVQLGVHMSSQTKKLRTTPSNPIELNRINSGVYTKAFQSNWVINSILKFIILTLNTP